MAVTAEQFNKAFAEFQLFGPRRRISIQERWRDVLPDADSREFDALEAQCKEIEAFALTLAEQVRDKATSDEAARRQLSQRYPILNTERLEHTWSQAVYFSLK